jgi:hypothetical protein
LVYDEQGRISLSPCKPLGQKICSETLIPCSRCLFKTIKYILQLVNMMGMMRILKSFLLFYINFILNSVQKDTLYIHLMKLEYKMASDGEEF